MGDDTRISDRPRSKAVPKLTRSVEGSQPWTTTRCHRLLRPLVSRIASLRKDVAASLSKPSEQSPGPQRTGAKRHSGDCDWLLPNKKAKLHRTYSQRRSRGSTQQEPSSDGKSPNIRAAECSRSHGAAKLRGEIVPPTPLLRRARRDVVPSPPLDSSTSGESQQVLQSISQAGDAKARRRQTLPQKQLDDRLAALKPGLPPGRHSDYEAIYRSLETLLTATNVNPGETERRGPMSFLDMCLRKVPQYITELEAWERSEAERNGTFSALENTDTSTHIYGYLESLGASQGWRHLRVIVRADGLKAVKDAIVEGLFDDAFLELLIDLCVVAGAPKEAEELLEAMVQREYPCPDTPDTSFGELASTQPLLTLWSYASKANRTRFLLRQHALLLSSGNLPCDWLGTREFERIWNLAIQGISKAEDANEATEFMISSISLLCTRKRRPGARGEQPQPEKELAAAGQQALASVLATMAAMSSLGENGTQSSYPGPEAEAVEMLRIGNRLRFILQASLAKVTTSSRSQAVIGVRLLYLALFLSSTERWDEEVAGTVKESIEAIDRQQRTGDYNASTRAGDRLWQQYDAMISLVSSTARSRARGLSLPSHDCLDTLFRQLGEALGLGEDGVLGRMKAAAAFTLAQQTHNVRDLIYAEKLSLGPSRSSSTARGENAIGKTSEDGPFDEESQPRPLFAGYRWDASIGEWVTVSPVKRRPRQQTVGRRLLRSSTGSLGLKPYRLDHDQDHDQDLSRDQERLPTLARRNAARSGHPRPSNTITTIHRMKGEDLGLDGGGTRNSYVRRRHSSCPQEVGRTRAKAKGPVIVHGDPITPPRSFRHIYMSTTHPDSPRSVSVPVPTIPVTVPAPTPASRPAPAPTKPSKPKVIGAKAGARVEDPLLDELGREDDKENRDRVGRRDGPRLGSASAKRIGGVLAPSTRMVRRTPSSLLRRSVVSTASGDVSSEDELGL